MLLFVAALVGGLLLVLLGWALGRREAYDRIAALGTLPARFEHGNSTYWVCCAEDRSACIRLLNEVEHRIDAEEARERTERMRQNRRIL